MAAWIEHPITIDEGLRLVFFGLECVLDITLDASECERILREAGQGLVSSKLYYLYRSSRLVVSGRVAEQEPETILLRLEGRLAVEKQVDRVT